MKSLTVLVLWAASAVAWGDAASFSALLRSATVTEKTSIAAATATRASAEAVCAQQAARAKRTKWCYNNALAAYNSAILAAQTQYNSTVLTGAGGYLGVPATTLAVNAELARLEAIQFAQDFAAQQAKIDACMLANVGSTDPHICGDLTGY